MEEALAKARAIAAKLAGGSGGASALGKRSWDSGNSAGLGATKKKKVYIPAANHPDVNFLGLLIGPRGATQKALQDKTGAKILVRGKGSSNKEGGTGHPDDDDELHVLIEGSDEAIAKAMVEVEAILFNPEEAQRLKSEQLKSMGDSSTAGFGGKSESVYGPSDGGGGNSQLVELRVPNNMVGLIIGKGGENVTRMQSLSGANMQIAKENEMKPGDTTRSIVLKGSADAVADLKRRVEEVIINHNAGGTGGASGTAQKSKEYDYPFIMHLPVPNDKVGIIIGRAGSVIKGIQDRSGANVQIPPEADADNPMQRTLVVGGPSNDSVEAAHKGIFEALQQYAQNIQTPPANAVFISVPDDKVGLIIGKGGMTIKDIQNRNGVKIQIPTAADPGTYPPIRSISIQGAPDSQLATRYEIEVLLGLTSAASGGSSYGQQSYGQTAYGSQPTSSQYYQQGYQDPYAGYGAQYQQQYQQAAYPDTALTEAAAEPAKDPNDPTAYYDDFWKYAAYYGEEAARVYYKAWSPPEGSVDPNAVNVAASTGTTTEATGGVAATTTEGAASDVDTAAAYEEYLKQYAEWWAASGKAQGAPEFPDPPAGTTGAAEPATTGTSGDVDNNTDTQTGDAKSTAIASAPQPSE